MATLAVQRELVAKKADEHGYIEGKNQIVSFGLGGFLYNVIKLVTKLAKAWEFQMQIPFGVVKNYVPQSLLCLGNFISLRIGWKCCPCRTNSRRSYSQSLAFGSPI